MLEKLASSLGRKDDEPNIALAVELSESNNNDGIKELISGLDDKSDKISSDCIKVLYEIGYRNPRLIADFTETFIHLLGSRKNRLVWGAMIALSTIASLKPQEISDNLGTIITAYEKGSVITIDASITVFAELIKADVDSEKKILKLLTQHLETCRPKEVPQHAERASICFSDENTDRFRQILLKRLPTLSAPQQKRVNKLLKKM